MSGVFILSILTAFESIDCEAISIFENPAYTHNNVQTLWVQSFGILPYTRVSFSTSHFGIGISNFGTELYKENELILGYTGTIKDVKLGISVCLMRVKIKEYGEAFEIGGTLGTSFQLTPSFNCAFAIHNFNSPKISGETIPRTLIGELSVNPSPQTTTKLQLYKAEQYPLEFKLTNEIELSNFLTLCIGIKNYPEAFTFGFLLRYKRLGLSYYTRTHPYLGLTHIIGLKHKL